MAQGVRRLLFDLVGACSIPSHGGRSVPSTVCPPVDNSRGGQSGAWTNRGVDNPWGGQSGGKNVGWLNREWRKQPYTEFTNFRRNQGKLLGSKRKCPFLKKFLQSDA